MNQVLESIVYFAEEGRSNMSECLRLSFAAALQYGLQRIIIFTGHGDGIQEAVDDFLSQPHYSEIRLIGVTFAQGFEAKREGLLASHAFPEERKNAFNQVGIPIVRAHLPFDAISTQHQHSGVLAQDLSIVGNALNIFCGSMSLCIQAVLMACDAGEVGIGEHVIVMTSDTSLLVRAAPTSRLLNDLVVRQIICKPAFLTIAKAEKLSLPQQEKPEQLSIGLAELDDMQLEFPADPL